MCETTHESLLSSLGAPREARLPLFRSPSALPVAEGDSSLPDVKKRDVRREKKLGRFAPAGTLDELKDPLTPDEALPLP